MKDERLELLSDKVRQGIPINFFDAIEVVAYQEKLKEMRENSSIWGKIKQVFKI
jgi:Ethanolamine utilization protein EutJ (predicted chaperonin)